MPDALPFDYVITSASMTGTTGTNVQSLILDEDTWFELCSVQASSSLDAATDQQPNNFSVSMLDSSTGRLFSGGPSGSPSGVLVPQALIAPFNPEYTFRRKVFFPPNANIIFNFANLDASACIATMVLRGFRHFELPPNSLTNDKCIPFDYLVNPTLAANGNSIQTLTLDQASNFEHHMYAGRSSIDVEATGVMPNNYSIRIQDSRGPYFSNARVPQRIITPYNNKYMADRPTTWGPGKNLQFDFLDLSGSENVVTFIMRGFKFFL